jgi:hypothetical protein
MKTHRDIRDRWGSCPCDECRQLRISHHTGMIKSMSSVLGRDLIAAIRTIAKADESELFTALNDAEQLGTLRKAGDGVEDYLGNEKRNRLPSRRDYRIGRPQSASGHGAAAMVREFSDPDQQTASVDLVERLGSMLDELSDRVDDVEKATGQTLKNHRGILSLLAMLGDGRGAEVAKALKFLLKADREGDEPDEDKDDREPEEAEAEAKGGAIAELRALMAGLPTMTASEMFSRTFSRGGAVAKAQAVVGAIRQNIAADEGLDMAGRMAAAGALTALEAAVGGAAPMELAKARIQALPTAAARHFSALV